MKLRIQTCGDNRTYLFRNGSLALLPAEDAPANDLADGDMLVICSASLAEAVNTDEMEAILSNDYEPALGLVERAKDNGAGDNVSASVALLGEGDFAPGSADDDYDDDGRFDAWA